MADVGSQKADASWPVIDLGNQTHRCQGYVAASMQKWGRADVPWDSILYRNRLSPPPSIA